MSYGYGYGQPLYANPYQGLFDTSGEGDDDDGSEELAEQVSEEILASGGDGDTGAIGFQMPNLGQLTSHIGGQLAGMLGGRAPSPQHVQKVVKKVQKKIQVKAPARAAQRAAIRMPQQGRVFQPIMGPVAGRAMNLDRIGSMNELKERVPWAQLVSLTNAPLAVGILAVVPATLTTSRSGLVLDWLTNDASTGVVASGLTYEQEPETIFQASPLEAWNSKAANPSPIAPIQVQSPVAWNVTLTGTGAAATVVTWTMSGIPTRYVRQALSNPSIAAFLADRGMALARDMQGGG